MSPQDGWQVLSALKTDPDLAPLPVLLVSMDDQQRGFALGLAELIASPRDYERLVQTVRCCVSHQPLSPSAANGSVLVVEPSQTIADLLRGPLASDGWQVEAATTSQEALAAMARLAPAMLVLDLLLPELDGVRLIHALRARPGWVECPILLVTTHDLTGPERAKLQTSIAQALHTSEQTYADLAWQLRHMVTRYGIRTTHLSREPAHGKDSSC
jgi:hypothetical protein